MSTASLPSYVPPTNNPAPSYSYEPQESEQILAIADSNVRHRPLGTFVKQSKNGQFILRLSGQQADAAAPSYGLSTVIEGVVEVTRTDGITRVEVKVEGYLKLREIGEGGHATVKLCLDNRVLWAREGDNITCPSASTFSFRLPENFTFEDKTYPLPPTHDVKLSGFPGFTANIDYSISVLINKPNNTAISSKAKGLLVGATAIHTPFVYHPRTKPHAALPSPLVTDASGFVSVPEWTLFESTLPSKQPGLQDITAKLYVPASRTFHLSESIPFHLALHSSPMSLAQYLPLSPTSKHLNGKKPTQVQLMRQSTVDVKNGDVVGKVSREIWRTDCIGEGTITLTADSASWIAYNGEIRVDPGVAVPGFKAAGLSVKDFILFTIMPPDLVKGPFEDLRQVVSIKLTTDAWTPNGAGIGSPASAGSYPSSQEG